MLTRGKAKPSCAAEGLSPEPTSKGYEENIEGGGEPHPFEVNKPKPIVKPRKRLCLEEDGSDDWSEDGSSQVEEQRLRKNTPYERIDPAANVPHRRPDIPELQGENYHQHQMGPRLRQQGARAEARGPAAQPFRLGLPNPIGFNVPSNYQVSTPLFNGKGRWGTFIKQFQAIAQNAQWSQEEKFHYLLVSLKDEAAEYAFDLESDILEDYDTLVHELDLRFHVTSTTDNYQQLFYSRKIRPNESLREYAADLKRLILRAFPRGVSPDVREDMTLKQFFDGLHDEDARYHIQALQHPRSIDHAVELLQQYYNYCSRRGQFSRNRPIVLPERNDGPTQRGRGHTRPNPVQFIKEDLGDEALRLIQGQIPATKSEDLRGEVEQLMKSVSEMGRKIVTSVEGVSKVFDRYLAGQNKAYQPMNNKPPVTCYRCGIVGHISRECPRGPFKKRPQKESQGN